VTADPFGPHAIAVVFVTVLAVLGSVPLRHEMFSLRWRRLGRRRLPARRSRIPSLMLALVLLQVVEIWISGFSHDVPASVYTTLGFGDLAPRGAIRFLTGTGAISGFLLISWSASFTVLEMQRFCKQDD
jgi:hypothetical protein